MELHVIETEIKDRVGILRLNRPGRGNSWTQRMNVEYRWVMSELDRDPQVRVIVVTGAGLYLVELVDLAIAADDATFSHAEQRLGRAGNTWHLNSQILMYGAKKARELLLLGDNFSGRDAERMGLVNRAVPPSELEDTVEDWARRIARHPRDALVTGKAMHQMALDSLGGSQQFWRGYVGHTLGTNLRFEEDEFNFLRERAKGGTTKTFKRRDDSFE